MDNRENPEAKGEVEGLSSQAASCVNCGMPRSEWTENGGQGVEKDSVIYCSQACAEGIKDRSQHGGRQESPAGRWN